MEGRDGYMIGWWSVRNNEKNTDINKLKYGNIPSIRSYLRTFYSYYLASYPYTKVQASDWTEMFGSREAD